MAAAFCAAAPPASAKQAYPVRGLVQPGPRVLHSGRPIAPVLDTFDSRFRANPLLVAGADGYVHGEYLYQDYLYDDWGADTGYSDTARSDSAGDLEYPTNRARYQGNAADLVEFRISPGSRDVAYRFTFNTLTVRDSTIVSLAFDTDRNTATGGDMLPGDPGAPFPGTDEVITAWGTGATHTRLMSTGAKTTRVRVTTSLRANQITVFVPRKISNPRGVWRATLATGIQNPRTHEWLKPRMGDPTADEPGGGNGDPRTPGIFNLAFRFNENPHGITPMDVEQASALADGTPTAFAHDIDFRLLDRPITRTTVPSHGTIVRVFPSRLSTEGGKDYTRFPETRSQLQQYSLYIPSKYRPSRPAGLTLMLHSLGEHHWQYNDSIGVQQVGEQRTNFVLTPEARGEDGWYQAEGEYDVFEAWNDAARHYSLDANRVSISGYSMGGYAAYRLGTLWPDLFARAFTTVGPPAEGIWAPPLQPTGAAQGERPRHEGEVTNTNVWLENARNVPYLNVVAGQDEFVPYPGTYAQNLGMPQAGIRGFEQLGYRYRFVTYTPAEHATLAILSYDVPMAASFLGDARVDRDPTHVTFTYAPGTDDRRLGLVHNHAYWVSSVELADPARGTPIPKATVDAVSEATGWADAQPSSDEIAYGTEPLSYVSVSRGWHQPQRIRPRNRITLNLSNVGSLRLDLGRAGIDPQRPVVLVTQATDRTTLWLAVDDRLRELRVPPGRKLFRIRLS